MIFDRLENRAIYSGLSRGLCQALDYLGNNDFTRMDAGRYDLEGDAMFALVEDYKTMKEEDLFYEAHRKYVDVQCIVSGSELIGHAVLNGQKVLREYNEEEDYAFYEAAGDFKKFEPGIFAVFFPQDLHMPCLGDGISEVRKVIIKLKVGK